MVSVIIVRQFPHDPELPVHPHAGNLLLNACIEGVDLGEQVQDRLVTLHVLIYLLDQHAERVHLVVVVLVLAVGAD